MFLSPAWLSAFNWSQAFFSLTGDFLVSGKAMFLRVAASFVLSSAVLGQKGRSSQSPPGIKAGGTGDPQLRSLNCLAEFKPIWKMLLEKRLKPGKFVFVDRGWLLRSMA